VLDDAKHYWVAPDEVDKLLRAGEGWLATHPARELIAHRYLTRQRKLAAVALERLEALAQAEEEVLPESSTVDEEGELPAQVRRAPLAAQRAAAVVAALADSGATRVLDLGCGAGALLAELVKDRRYTRLIGVDVSTEALRMAERRLQRHATRVGLLQSALTYTDDRLKGFDAAVLMEVIEHVDPPRLPAVEASVFGHAQPSTVVVTTPNVEYNPRYEGMAEGALRHHDHRFEWTRAEFAAWTERVATTYGYTVTRSGVGEDDPTVGAPTQLAVFTREGAS
jgi:3' terminal RNA ribose 2'-O-methyltransferase Hen1